MSQFIGRGEPEVKIILPKLLGVSCLVYPQYEISRLIPAHEIEILGPEHNKHKFDFYVEFILPNTHGFISRMVIEVNYKHGNIPARKWFDVYAPLMKKYGILTCTIDDFDCRDRGVFWLNSKNVHPKITWDDFRDVIDALQKAGIDPNVG